MADDAELRVKLTEMGVDVGPITDSTRALYRRMLRKRHNEQRASTVGSAAKKHKPAPSSSPSSSATGVAKARAASTKPRRNGPVGTRRVTGKAGNGLSGASRRTAVVRVSHTPPLPSRPPLQQDRPPSFAPSPSPRIYPLLPPLPPSPIHPPSPSSSTPKAKPSPHLSPPSLSLHRHNSSGANHPPLSPFSSPQKVSSPSSSSQKVSSPSSSSTQKVSSPSSSSSTQKVSSSHHLSSSSSTDSSSGMVTTITSWVGSRVKNILDRIKEAASPTPRRPLSRTPSQSSPSAPSAPQPNLSRDSISIDQLDFADGDPNSSPGPVYLHIPSPPRNPTHSHLPPSPPHRPTGSSGVRYDWELQPEEVEICKKSDGELWLLGRGGCGQVYRGLKDGVDEVAVKVIRLQGCDPRSAMSQFKQEIDTISRLRHRNVLQFYGACIKPSCLFMVTELMDTDLFSALREHGSKYMWSGQHGREILLGIASGLHHLHSRRPPIVHRDIKSPNILVMGGLAKIADVGIANTMAATDMTAQRGFTIAWAAPEVILRKRANEKIDVWSFGIILWEVVSGRVPRPGQLVFPAHAPGGLQTLYSRCTSDDPSSRPSAADIIHTLKQP